MIGWDDAIAAITGDFIEQLEQRGYRANGLHLSGDIQVNSTDVRIRIEIPECFPFVPPVVLPPKDFPRSWHRDLDGAMCLYPVDGRENLPWLDVNDFLQTSARWLEESVSGWTDDFPDLDLERYFTSANEPLVVYGDLDSISSSFIQLRHEKYVTRVVGAGSVPKGAKGLRKHRAFGYIVSIGELAMPPGNWNDLSAMLPTGDVRTVEVAIRDRRLSYLIVRYSRGGLDAAVTLRAYPSNSGSIELVAVRSACDAPSVLRLRAGSKATRLGATSVVVVGAGAIGSFLCDLLARAGVGTITIYDHDLVRPGNLIRHFVGVDAIGQSKPVAIGRAIESRPFNSSVIVPVPQAVADPRRVMSLYAENDLVIDASAAGGITDMLAKAAIAGEHHLLSVCLQAEGAIARVDIIPPLHGEPLPPKVIGRRTERESLKFESGCGDPVSETPAYAVLEAASLAARCAVGILTGDPICSAGIIHDYR